MAVELRWAKIRLDAATRSVLDRAVGRLSLALGEKLLLVRHPSGKTFACRVDDLWFCQVGDGGQPARVWTIAVDTRPEPRTLLPTENDADFVECCDLMGLRTIEDQDQLRDFLSADPGSNPLPRPPGAP